MNTPARNPSQNPSRLFAKRKLRKRLGDPVPCGLCYYPLDAYGCCLACERRAEADDGDR